MQSVVDQNVFMQRIPYCCVIFRERLSLTAVATDHITELGGPLAEHN
jgi:hypothetical protein